MQGFEWRVKVWERESLKEIIFLPDALLDKSEILALLECIAIPIALALA